MRIEKAIIVNDHASVTGGQPKIAIETALGLKERALDVTFFSTTGPIDGRLAAAGIDVVCLNQPDIIDGGASIGGAVRGIWNFKASRALSAVLGDCDPTTSLVHFHGCDKGLSPAVGRAIVESNLPHLLTMHGYFLACPNGGFFDYQAQEICTRKALGASCLRTNCDSRSRLHKGWRIARQVVQITAGNLPSGLKNIAYISETERKVMADYIPASAKLHHLPNPISVDKNDRVPAEANDAFVFVGRLNPEKGCVDFAKAAKAAGVRAVFVGDGQEREAILAANPEAEITGWVTPDEVEMWLSKARALVLPSLWYETFGLVAYEGIAKGVPCIVGSWNAAAEAVRDGDTGLIYATRNDLQRALEQAKDTALIDQMSRAAYDSYWANPLTPDRYIDRLLAIYDEL